MAQLEGHIDQDSTEVDLQQHLEQHGFRQFDKI